MIALPPDAAPPERRHKYDDKLANMEAGTLYWFEDPIEGIGVARAWRQRTGMRCLARHSHDAAGGMYLLPSDQPIQPRKPRQ